MKKLIANFFILVTLLSGSASLAAASSNGDLGLEPSISKSSLSNAGYYRAPSNSTNTHRIWMNAGTRVSVSLSGDGDTDLDLFVYDSSGLIAKSTDDWDDEGVELMVYRSGYFTVNVVNRGSVYNDYVLKVSSY